VAGDGGGVRALSRWAPPREACVAAFVAKAVVEDIDGNGQPDSGRVIPPKKAPGARAPRERFGSAERVLGGRRFVADAEAVLASRPAVPGLRARMLQRLLEAVAAELGISSGHLVTGDRCQACTEARAALAYLWIDRFGHPARVLAAEIGVSHWNALADAFER
jgi:hypothetical protein